METLTKVIQALKALIVLLELIHGSSNNQLTQEPRIPGFFINQS